MPDSEEEQNLSPSQPGRSTPEFYDQDNRDQKLTMKSVIPDPQPINIEHSQSNPNPTTVTDPHAFSQISITMAPEPVQSTHSLETSPSLIEPSHEMTGESQPKLIAIPSAHHNLGPEVDLSTSTKADTHLPEPSQSTSNIDPLLIQSESSPSHHHEPDPREKILMELLGEIEPIEPSSPATTGTLLEQPDMSPHTAPNADPEFNPSDTELDCQIQTGLDTSAGLLLIFFI